MSRQVSDAQVSMFKVICLGGASVPKTEPLPEVRNCVWCIQNLKTTFHVPSQVFPKPTSHVLRFRNRSLMFKVLMLKVKIPNPNCKSHFQSQNSETHASFSMSRFRNPFLLFNLKFYQIFGALAFPKRSPSQKYKILFAALKIRSPLFMFKVKFPKPTSRSKPSQDSGTHVSCSKPRCSESRFRNPGSHVQSQDSKSQLQVSCS